MSSVSITGQFVLAERVGGLYVCEFDQLSALAPCSGRQRLGRTRGDDRAGSAGRAVSTPSRLPFSAVAVERLGVVDARARRPRRSPESAGSEPAMAVSRIGDVGDAARHRAGAYPGCGEIGTMWVRRDQAHGRLQPDQAGDDGGAGDRAVGLGADAAGGQGRRRSPRRSRTTSRRRCGPAHRGSSPGRRRADQPLIEWSERILAHSDRLVLPRITAPAAFSRATTGASRPG